RAHLWVPVFAKLAQSARHDRTEQPMTVHLTPPFVVAPGVEFPDQRIPRLVGLNELDREALLGCPDDPPGEIADLVYPQHHRITVPARCWGQDRGSVHRNIDQGRGERTGTAPAAHRFRCQQALLTAVARELDASSHRQYEDDHVVKA